MKKQTTYNRKIKFHDADNKITFAKLEITNRNNYPEFSMTNLGSQKKFNPKNGLQTKLYNIWNQYHLNGMSSGLPVQMIAITKWEKQGNKYDYNKICKYLKLIDLYEIPLKENLPKGFFLNNNTKKITDTETYKYGNGWIHCVLPKNFTTILNILCNNIEKEEQKLLNSKKKLKWSDIENNKIIALGKHLKILPIEAQEDIIQSKYDECEYSYTGIEYFVCTNEEADEKEDEYLDYYIEECLKIPEEIKPYFKNEDWKKDAKIDGRGHSLSSYDGYEHSETVNEINYYIYKQ